MNILPTLPIEGEAEPPSEEEAVEVVLVLLNVGAMSTTVHLGPQEGQVERRIPVKSVASWDTVLPSAGTGMIRDLKKNTVQML
jgi:hypothetical protein